MTPDENRQSWSRHIDQVSNRNFWMLTGFGEWKQISEWSYNWWQVPHIVHGKNPPKAFLKF